MSPRASSFLPQASARNPPDAAILRKTERAGVRNLRNRICPSPPQFAPGLRICFASPCLRNNLAQHFRYTEHSICAPSLPGQQVRTISTSCVGSFAFLSHDLPPVARARALTYCLVNFLSNQSPSVGGTAQSKEEASEKVAPFPNPTDSNRRKGVFQGGSRL